jgi:ABC-type transport system substrate-binding protein
MNHMNRLVRTTWPIVLFPLMTLLLTAKSFAAEGTLVFGRGGDSVSLDPATCTDGESFNVTDHIYETLVRFRNGTTLIEPGLAESWDVRDNGLTYVFRLRSGVKFHDGSALNADAVVYNFLRQIDENHPGYKLSGPYPYASSQGLTKLIDSVTRTDDQTVVFRIKKAHAPFLAKMALNAFAIVSPKALATHKQELARNPVGTGPFEFVRWEKNQKIVLRANRNYWGPAPKIANLIFRAIPDNSTRVQEMMAGNLHVMDNPDPNSVEALKSRLGDKVRLEKMAGFNVGFLSINTEKKPFDNVLVRRALAHAVNKQAIINAVYNGYAVVAKNPLPPTSWGHNDKIQDYEYSPEKAKALLREAGLKDGFETTLFAMPVPRNYMPDGRKAAESIQADLAAVGIRAKIVSYDWATYLKMVSHGEHDLAILGWSGDIADPDNFLFTLLDKDNAGKPGTNRSFYKGEELHKLLTRAQETADQKVREKLYLEAQTVISRDVPLVPLAHSTQVVPVLSSVEGFQMDPTGRRKFADASVIKR